MKAERKELTQSVLKEHLSYDAKTGEFTRIKVGNRAPQRLGRRAGGTSSDGYVRVSLFSRLYLAHRLVWLYTYGEFPPNLIDHINGDRSDNRLVNLREATHSMNLMNAGMWRTNTSGVKGVSWSKKYKRWEAFIKKDGVRRFLGHFFELDLAAKAVREAREKLHGEFANHG